MERQELWELVTDTVQALLVLMIFLPIVNILDRADFT